MNQQCLFNEEINIPGLSYISSYISSAYEEKLLKLIDTQEWNVDLKRRTQHYGYKYDYTARSLDASSYLGKIPYSIDDLCSKLHGDGTFEEKPDQRGLMYGMLYVTEDDNGAKQVLSDKLFVFQNELVGGDIFQEHKNSIQLDYGATISDPVPALR